MREPVPARPAWSGSTRRSRLPRNWGEIRDRILERDPTCSCEGCKRCTDSGCSRPSTDADHVQRNDDHSDANLRGLCSPCHLLKSAREGNAARQSLAPRRRPRETHPGRL